MTDPAVQQGHPPQGPPEQPAERRGGSTPGSSRAGSGRGALLLGLVMVLGGAGLLGYVGWQLYGTTYVSQQAQQDLVERLEEDWGGPGAATTPREGGTLTAKETDEGGTGPAILRIPALGEDYAVPILDGVDEQTLTEGLGHFPDAADPGEVGNYALAGHRITHGEPFRDLPSLRPGDRVLVDTRDTRYVYELITDPNDLVVDFSQVWVVDRKPTNPTPGGVQPPQRGKQRLITLTTCSELFHTDDRMIAFGELVRAVPRDDVSS